MPPGRESGVCTRALSNLKQYLEQKPGYTMASLKEIISYTDQLLSIGSYNDASLNGLQVQSYEIDSEVTHLGAAVDGGESVLLTATQRGVDLLFVHHGLFWGVCRPITGPLARKLQTLFTGRCSLYCAHLPLDGHATIGNGALLARLLGLTITGAVTDGHQPVGVFATVSPKTCLPTSDLTSANSSNQIINNKDPQDQSNQQREVDTSQAMASCQPQTAGVTESIAHPPLSLANLGLVNQSAAHQNLDHQGVTLEELVSSVQGALSSGRTMSPAAPQPYVLPFGPKRITSVAIVSGSGGSLIERCAKQGIDLFISGEPKQEVYHLVKELGINALFAGHYATETLGVRALVTHLSEKFGVTYDFIDEETGI